MQTYTSTTPPYPNYSNQTQPHLVQQSPYPQYALAPAPVVQYAAPHLAPATMTMQAAPMQTLGFSPMPAPSYGSVYAAPSTLSPDALPPAPVMLPPQLSMGPPAGSIGSASGMDMQGLFQSTHSGAPAMGLPMNSLSGAMFNSMNFGNGGSGLAFPAPPSFLAPPPLFAAEAPLAATNSVMSSVGLQQPGSFVLASQGSNMMPLASTGSVMSGAGLQQPGSFTMPLASGGSVMSPQVAMSSGRQEQQPFLAPMEEPTSTARKGAKDPKQKASKEKKKKAGKPCLCC